jgi:hypothetical protein
VREKEGKVMASKQLKFKIKEENIKKNSNK